MRKIALILGILICLTAVSIFLPVHGETAVYDTVVRLHVLANSDTEEDQALKLRVRDAVLSVTTPLIGDCTDRTEAQRRLDDAKEDILSAAEAEVAAAGYDYPVTVSFCEEEYPEKDYGEFTFPAGTYLSMRVVIGEGAGRNWWCVLFPPLCLSAATRNKQETEDAFVSVGLNKEQYGVITETENTKYRVRFRLLELFGEMFR